MRTTLLLFLLPCTCAILRAQWTRIEAIPPWDVPSLHVSGNALYAGTDSAVFRTDDNGQNWTRSSTLPNAPIFIDAVFHAAGDLYAGTGGDGLHKSSDNGATWQSFSNGLVGLGSGFLSELVLREGTLYCGTVGAGAFLRTNGAWQPFDDLAAMNAGNVHMLKSWGDTLWSGAGGNGFIWRSLPGSTVFDAFQVAPLQGQAHLVTDILRRGSELLIGGTYGIFRSADGGATWTGSSTGLPPSGTVQFLEVGNALYALRSTSDTRLYRSMDNGHTWQLEESMPYCFAMVHYGDRLYAARIDGLWAHEAMTLGVPAEQEDDLVRVYPNPTAADVIIERPDRIPAPYRLLDTHGRVLYDGQLVLERTPLQLALLAAGVYLLQVLSGDRWGQVRIVVQ
ncbi:MAG: T9SS type A sorting domain-containing protein [Flavobacteriales bacterium]|nr:T9SS type A sorting domain-containing protein [Flavobacteriales bacterium]MBK6754370.1 T9SS type A sorting domain-containing protein [Flavobacteriales bacterium]